MCSSGKASLRTPRTGLNPMNTARNTIDFLESRAHWLGGLIVLDKERQIGFPYNTRYMAFAYINEKGEVPGISQ